MRGGLSADPTLGRAFSGRSWWRPRVALDLPGRSSSSWAVAAMALGLGMREILKIYLSGDVLLLILSTSIRSEDKISLDHILIAAFGWPILLMLLMCVRSSKPLMVQLRLTSACTIRQHVSFRSCAPYVKSSPQLRRKSYAGLKVSQ